MGTTARTLIASLTLGASLLTAAPALASPPPGPATFGVATTTPPEPEPQPPAADDLVAEPDAPAAPTVSLGGASIDEGDDLELTGIIFSGSISAPCAGPVVLTYDIVGWHPNPATAGSDFLAVDDGQVVLAPGETGFSFGTLVTGDAMPEADERLMAAIHTVEGCAEMPGGQVTASGTIRNDDVQLVSIDDVEVVEGDAGTTDLVFTVSLDGPALIDYSVNLDWGPGTATPDVDFVDDLPSSLFFLVGTESQTVTVSVVGDLEVEGGETLTVALHGGSFGLDSVDAIGFGTILDDDVAPMAGPGVDEDGAQPEDEPEAGDDHTDGGDASADVLDETVERGGLPRTGATLGVLALLGAALVAAGRAVIALTRP